MNACLALLLAFLQGSYFILEGDSALFRHEVAYVLGQMQQPSAIPHLSEVLANSKEHDMVRHEAAEALGSCIGMDDGQGVTEKEKVISEPFLRQLLD